MNWIRENLAALTLIAVFATAAISLWQTVLSRRATIGQNLLTIRSEMSSLPERERRGRVMRALSDNLIPGRVEDWSRQLKTDVEHVGQLFDAYGLLAKHRIISRRMAISFYGASAVRCYPAVKQLIDWRVANERWTRGLWIYYQWFVSVSGSEDNVLILDPDVS